MKKTNNTNGTSFQAHIETSYGNLVHHLGNPHITAEESKDGKTDAEWGFKFPDGTIATIYNYKDGKNYLGEKGKAVEDIILWHTDKVDFNKLSAEEILNKAKEWQSYFTIEDRKQLAN